MLFDSRFTKKSVVAGTGHELHESSRIGKNNDSCQFVRFVAQSSLFDSRFTIYDLSIWLWPKGRAGFSVAKISA